MSAATLDRAEWDFENVAGDIRYFCLYEYAREAELERSTIAESSRAIDMERATTRGRFSAQLPISKCFPAVSSLGHEAPACFFGFALGRYFRPTDPTTP